VSLRETRLIDQEPNDSIARIKNTFVEMARTGIRPIWLATGGAWTGLDLTDEGVTDPTQGKTESCGSWMAGFC